MERDFLRVTDGRSGRARDVAVEGGAVSAGDLAALRDGELVVLDHGLAHTAACRSRITSIDPAGGLAYRGHPVEQLAERAGWLDAAYLLWNGELPSPADAAELGREVAVHAFLHEDVKRFLRGFRYDAAPLAIVTAAVGALGTFYPEARRVHDRESRRLQMIRLLAKLPTLVAWAYRHALGMPAPAPDPELSLAGSFLAMARRLGDRDWRPDPRLEAALDAAWVVLADHGQACSTHVVRAVASAQGDPYAALAAGCAALSGPLHGGAGDAVWRMWRELRGREQVPAFVRSLREGDGARRLFGFGHRAYRGPDPRAAVLRRLALDVVAAAGAPPVAEVALELERVASQDEHLAARGLSPNADYWSALLWSALGFPPEMFAPLFAVARTAGWLAHWEEAVLDADGRLLRPRQVYEGPARRDVPTRSS